MAEASTTDSPKEGTVEVFVRYITKNGKRIYPKNGKCFHFFVAANRSK